jgi:nitroreductase
MKVILESARLSPSSFGMEPWRFIVVTTQELKEKIRPYCWDQPQITTCSHLVIVVANIIDPKPASPYTRAMFERRGLTPEMFERYCALYDRWIGRYNDDEFVAWCQKQCYIAAANMMSVGAMINVDSCPIEGFEEDGVSDVLGLDTSKEKIAMLLPLGYRINPVTPKYRRSFDDLVEYR